MRSLSARLLVMLTIALLPLGLIAVYQTLKVVHEAERIAESDYLARTVQAAGSEIGLIRRAHGVAYGLGTSAAAIENDEALCDEIMERFVAHDGQFVFAAYIPLGGRSICSSSSESVDFSTTEAWADFLQNPRRMVTVNAEGVVSGLPVFVAITPIFDEYNMLLGAGAVSTPLDVAAGLLESNIENLEIAIVDETGEVLASSGDGDERTFLQALGVSPKDLSISQPGLTLKLEKDGKETALAIVPLVGGETYIVGFWNDMTKPFAVSLLGTATPLFPMIMWLISLFVAFFAIDRLVLQYLKKLRARMAVFSADDFSGSYVRLHDAPREINEIANSYNQMIDRIAHDHETLARNVLEKDILLKEIHHRVKNNLQLIASILNMQLRQIESPEAKSVLRRVQDRVMSLATIHKSLYTDISVDEVHVDRLLDEIVKATLNVGASPGQTLDTTVELAPVMLHPDQAVPLSLLVTEAITNAVKYVSTSDDPKPKLTVKLTEPAPSEVRLIVENARGQHNGQDLSGTGMGARLIEAFVQQLGGDLDVTETDTSYAINVRFTKLGQIKSRSEAA